VKSRLTAKKQTEFEEALKTYSNMDFTEGNIRSFILNLIGSYERTIKDSVNSLFEEMTNYAFRTNKLYLDNIHYFNGWKTNDAFKVGKKLSYLSMLVGATPGETYPETGASITQLNGTSAISIW
jgi:hypothetical protein